jgi:hypothetical protein
MEHGTRVEPQSRDFDGLLLDVFQTHNQVDVLAGGQSFAWQLKVLTHVPRATRNPFGTNHLGWCMHYQRKRARNRLYTLIRDTDDPDMTTRHWVSAKLPYLDRDKR